ncbi:MAG: TonB-dependent receptor [Bacteroidales bacterium]|nr:TonB-dependent receptor [Bacteroidales bacterium]
MMQIIHRSEDCLKVLLLSAFLLAAPSFAGNLSEVGAAPNSSASTIGKKITGIVIDNNGEPVPGAAVLITGTQTGTITDVNGKYSLDVPENATITVSCLGFADEEITVRGSVVNVTLTPDTDLLDELVVVGYGTQKKGNLTTAISTIKSDDIKTTVSTSLAQRIQGKIPGVLVKQASGAPGAYDSMIRIRGYDAPLIVVDGMLRVGEAEFQRMNPEDIESITVLKDGAAAVYGMNAGNGVILVTTKHGSSGRAKFSYNGSVSLSSPTNFPEMCNAYEFATLYNDSFVNRGEKAPYSRATIENYRIGARGYESTDWYDLMYKKFSVQQQHTLSAEGGTEKVKYYMSLGYLRDEGLLRSNISNNDKYSYRVNVSAKLIDCLRADVEIGGFYDNTSRPYGGTLAQIIGGTIAMQPLHKAYANDNPDYLNYVYDGQTLNPLGKADPDKAGLSTTSMLSFNAHGSLTFDVPWVKGLQFKGLIRYGFGSAHGRDVQKSYDLYGYDPSTDTYIATTQQSPAKIEESISLSNELALLIQGTYDRTFAEAHHVSATLVYEQRRGWANSVLAGRYFTVMLLDQLNFGDTGDTQTTAAGFAESGYKSVVSRLSYDYKGKYMIDLASRYDGSYRYAPEHRWGFFPVVSVGWRMSEEGFIKNNINWLSNLKLRGSFGIVGEDAGTPFQYEGGFLMGAPGHETSEGVWTAGVLAPGLQNRDLTWYTSKMMNAGIDLGFFQSRLNVTYDLYRKDREGLLATRLATLPNTFGTSLPLENLNADRTLGMELSIDFKTDLGKDWTIWANANFNVSRTKFTELEQADPANRYGNWRGNMLNRWTDVYWMYNVIGQFQNYDEISFAPVQGTLQGNAKELPGDFIYEDVNRDGVIDGNDLVPIAHGGIPRMTYGLTLGASWRGLDFNMLWQGAAMYSVRYVTYYGYFLWNDANCPKYFLDRWHHEDPFDSNSAWVPGEWPAARHMDDVGGMYNESNRWRRDASYLRLKNISLGYSLPKRWISRAKLSNVRLGVSGYNLLTICDPFVKAFDPERSTGDQNTGWVYPLNRSVNFELSITF